MTKKVTNFKHGMRYTRVYKVWDSLKYRCNRKGLKNYNAKGITYDPKWQTFEGFYEDMGRSYVDGLQIDRIDSNKGYCKDNCRWVDIYGQNNNTSRNKNLTLDGKTKTLAQWGRCLGIKPDTLNKRLINGWSVRKALTTPLIKKYSFKKSKMDIFKQMKKIEEYKIGIFEQWYNGGEIRVSPIHKTLIMALGAEFYDKTGKTAKIKFL